MTTASAIAGDVDRFADVDDDPGVGATGGVNYARGIGLKAYRKMAAHSVHYDAGAERVGPVGFEPTTNGLWSPLH